MPSVSITILGWKSEDADCEKVNTPLEKDCKNQPAFAPKMWEVGPCESVEIGAVFGYIRDHP
jgi:hypothetical protein